MPVQPLDLRGEAARASLAAQQRQEYYDDMEDNRDVYLERRPWHDTPTQQWQFCRELEARWGEIRAEFDTLREHLRAKEKEGNTGGTASVATYVPPTLDSDDDELEKPDLEQVLHGGVALEPRIHPWPELNLYEKHEPRYVRDDDGQEIDTRRGVRGETANKPAAPSSAASAAAADGTIDEDQPAKGKGWDVFGIFAFGKKHYNNAKLCPLTTEIVERIPGCSTAAFSILAPGARILPHTGYYGYAEMILRCHLGLHVPANETKVWLQVAGIRRGWEEGKVFVFDDTFEHSAVNLTDRERVVLLLDFRAGKFDDETLAAMAERQTSDSQHEYLDNLVTAYGYGVKVPDEDDGEKKAQ